jgi:hypothetical protein
MKKLILLAALCLSLASCSTFRKAVDAANSNEAYVGPVVTLVTTTVFEQAVSPEDRQEKAVIVHKLAEKIAEIKFDKKPTKAEFATLIAAQLPDKSHWLVLASSLSEVYEKYTKNLTDSDVGNTLTVIHNIAEALALSTQRYL